MQFISVTAIIMRLLLFSRALFVWFRSDLWSSYSVLRTQVAETSNLESRHRKLDCWHTSCDDECCWRCTGAAAAAAAATRYHLRILLMISGVCVCH